MKYIDQTLYTRVKKTELEKLVAYRNKCFLMSLKRPESLWNKGKRSRWLIQLELIDEMHPEFKGLGVIKLK